MSDLISKKALIINLVDWQFGDFADADARHELEYSILDKVIKGIEEFPTVEAKEVVHGEWLVGSKPRCSVCGKSALREYDREAWLSYVPSDFCPHCGADMRKKV